MTDAYFTISPIIIIQTPLQFGFLVFRAIAAHREPANAAVYGIELGRNTFHIVPTRMA
jgi:hypothetical protein